MKVNWRENKYLGIVGTILRWRASRETALLERAVTWREAVKNALNKLKYKQNE